MKKSILVGFVFVVLAVLVFKPVSSGIDLTKHSGVGQIKCWDMCDNIILTSAEAPIVTVRINTFTGRSELYVEGRRQNLELDGVVGRMIVSPQLVGVQVSPSVMPDESSIEGYTAFIGGFGKRVFSHAWLDDVCGSRGLFSVFNKKIDNFDEFVWDIGQAEPKILPQSYEHVFTDDCSILSLRIVTPVGTDWEENPIILHDDQEGIWYHIRASREWAFREMNYANGLMYFSLMNSQFDGGPLTEFGMFVTDEWDNPVFSEWGLEYVLDFSSNALMAYKAESWDPLLYVRRDGNWVVAQVDGVPRHVIKATPTEAVVLVEHADDKTLEIVTVK